MIRFLSVTALITALSLLVFGTLARAGPPGVIEKMCEHVRSELITDIEKGYAGEVAIYDFIGADAVALQKSQEAFRGSPYKDTATTLAVVLWLSSDAVTIYSYDKDGCFFNNMTMGNDTAAAIIAGAGLTPPFGRTYYRLPNAPEVGI